ncbi:MAG: universal stress protein [Polaromonas sp.]
MKILLAADGSEYTKKALVYLAEHRQFSGARVELVVVHVQALLPTVLTAAISVEKALELQEAEAEKVFMPVRKFLDKHLFKYRCVGVLGSIAKEINDLAESEHVHLILMGTHGRDLIGRAVMGSVAQKVVAHSTVPVLLVK